MNNTFDTLATGLEARLDDGVDAHWSDSDFEQWAFTAFRHQFAACRTYRSFCELRGVTPSTVQTLNDVPAVPAAAFKHFDLVSGSGAPPELVFRTSGTTRGNTVRGRHLVPRASLYAAALRDPFRAALLPDRAALPFYSLVPAPHEAPDSSLSCMVGIAAERFASEVHWLVDGSGVWHEAFDERLGAAVEDGQPILLLGTALAFVHLLERGEASRVRLPDGSRVMETGGFKGARRVVSRRELYAGITETTGVPVERIVNEYGMTELLSQLYEPVLLGGSAVMGRHLPPPWLRVRALDPTSLEEVPEGDEGILAFFDLANLGSVCHVLTEDIGAIVDGQLRLRGRAAGAEPRGCSRAMDDLMSIRT